MVPSKSAYIISVVNQKGGVGKTTTCINLAAALSEISSGRVLLIDLDPQGNATTGLGLSRTERSRNIYDVLTGKCQAIDCIKHMEEAKLDLLPSTIDLAAAEFELYKLPNWRFVLRDMLASLKNSYEYILIDCPPSLGLLTINSLIASDLVIIPLQCEFFALEGLSHLLITIKKIKSSLNRKLEIDGVLLTMFDSRNRLSKFIEADVRKNLGDIVYETVIPRNVALPESSSHGKPINVYNKSSSGARAYARLAKELVSKHSQILITTNKSDISTTSTLD